MVRSPDIDQFSKAALVFISMICDVAGKISELPVAFDDRSVLIIAKLRRFVPFGAVLTVNQAALTQNLEALGDFTALAHGLFTEEGVEADIKVAKLSPDHVQ